MLTITLRRLLLRRLCCVLGRLWVDLRGFGLSLSRLYLALLLLRWRLNGGSDRVPVLISCVAGLHRRGDVGHGLLLARRTLDALRPVGRPEDPGSVARWSVRLLSGLSVRHRNPLWTGGTAGRLGGDQEECLDHF